MTRTTAQNSRFHTLLTARKFDREDKAELVSLMTNGRTTSSKEMSSEEMQLAIDRLEDAQVSSIKKMRAKIIHIARDIFSMDARDVWGQEHYDKLNVHLVRTCKNPLHKLTYAELPNAVTSMEKWRDWALKQMLKTVLNEL